MWRKFFKCLGIALLLASVWSAGMLTAEAAKKRVAIMPLEKTFVLSDSAESEETVASVMSDQLVVAVQESGNYTVVERTQFDKAMQEQGFQNLYADPEYAAEMGKIFGGQYILVGKITMVKTRAADKSSFMKRISAKFDAPYRTNIAVELRMVDCQTSEVVLAKTVEADRGGKDANDSLYNACKDVAGHFMRDIQAQFPFTGRIIEVKGSEIYVDQGQSSGLHKGDILLIAREDTPLEANGKIVGMTQISLGKAKVTEVLADYAICRITEGGSAIQKGDIVKRGK